MTVTWKAYLRESIFGFLALPFLVKTPMSVLVEEAFEHVN